MFRHIGFSKARKQSGQSTVEYIILVTAVLGVIILFMTGQNSVFQQKIGNTVTEATNQIKSKGGELADSHNTDPIRETPSKVNVDPTQNVFH